MTVALPLAAPEEALLQAVVDLAKISGWMGYHTRDSRGSAEGFPDLVLVRGDELLFVELKSEGGRVRPAQAAWLAALEAAGQEVHVWRPRDWEEIVHRLARRW